MHLQHAISCRHAPHGCVSSAVTLFNANFPAKVQQLIEKAAHPDIHEGGGQPGDCQRHVSHGLQDNFCIQELGHRLRQLALQQLCANRQALVPPHILHAQSSVLNSDVSILLQ